MLLLKKKRKTVVDVLWLGGHVPQTESDTEVCGQM